MSLELIDLLSPYLSDFELESESTEYVQEMLDRMIDAEDYDSYFKALSIMTGKTEDELNELSVTELFGLFIKGLVMNKILDLQDFAKGIGLHG